MQFLTSHTWMDDHTSLVGLSMGHPPQQLLGQLDWRIMTLGYACYVNKFSQAHLFTPQPNLCKPNKLHLSLFF